MRQGPEKDSVNHAKDGDACSDAKREHRNDSKAEGGSPAEASGAQPKVAQKLPETVRKPYPARAIPRLHPISETPQGGFPSGFSGKPALLELPCLRLDVKANFFVEILVKSPAVKQEPQPKPGLT
jgi:hypothetical protein